MFEFRSFMNRRAHLKDGNNLFESITERHGLREGSLRSTYQCNVMSDHIARLLISSGLGTKIEMTEELNIGDEETPILMRAKKDPKCVSHIYQADDNIVISNNVHEALAQAELEAHVAY